MYVTTRVGVPLCTCIVLRERERGCIFVACDFLRFVCVVCGRAGHSNLYCILPELCRFIIRCKYQRVLLCLHERNNNEIITVPVGLFAFVWHAVVVQFVEPFCNCFACAIRPAVLLMMMRAARAYALTAINSDAHGWICSLHYFN